ncbi:MAG: cation:dicarboxylase symporter family transporter, partial [Planctomycetota bacterium]
MALHWKILIGLVVGVVVGIIINIAWDAETWSGLGVEEPAAFLEGQQSRAVLPDGFDRVEDLDPANPNLRGKTVDTVTMAQIERYGLETVEINPDSEFLAHAALFLRNLNDFVGDLFMRGLRFIAVPIVLFSLIVGGASLGDLNKLGRVGGKTVGLYMLTTAFAITLGLGLANIVGPGRGIDQTFVDQLIAATQADVEARVGQAAERPSPWQVALDVIPPNPFGALAAAEMLQVVMTGLLIGLALTKLPESKSRPVVAFFDAMTNVIIEVVHWVLKIAPVAVFALICGVVAELGLDVLGKL